MLSVYHLFLVGAAGAHWRTATRAHRPRRQPDHTLQLSRPAARGAGRVWRLAAGAVRAGDAVRRIPQ